MCDTDCCCSHPSGALLDAALMVGVFFGVESLLGWLESLMPVVWLRWLMLPLELAILVGAIIGAYESSIYKKYDGNYDKYDNA